MEEVAYHKRRNDHMENYIFVCIGTNKLIEDSFGPRVGEILQFYFYQKSNIEVLGTLKCPIHFQNAPIFIDYLKNKKGKFILIDSALSNSEQIGKTYLNIGGIEIGKAWGKKLYFPSHFHIKTVVGAPNIVDSKREKNARSVTKKEIYQVTNINRLATNLAMQIVKNF